MRDPVDERTQALRLDAVIDEAAVTTFGDEAGIAQHREMLGNRRL